MSQRSNVTEIKCSDCGKTATVPFKPTAGKPVYCRECLANQYPKAPNIEAQQILTKTSLVQKKN
jgi:CxxC-x17-CxxC domain-containing protein